MTGEHRFSVGVDAGEQDMKAIETVYHGYEFRSRIEARWAVVFDTLDLEWEYEPESYDFGIKRHWDEREFQEYLQEALEWQDGDDREEVIR